ncbi:hypothetical protein POM88_019480 [Heracleum sosnowskyi]|uniref:Uncharacterized protein n=1 Tax=Heracleum sosnowskyi TaxID=360622 RepID=A0AAD8ID31_9APIA|nr:hypothetical protein POM88_019480 [Heracleum sosnowskyi]
MQYPPVGQTTTPDQNLANAESQQNYSAGMQSQSNLSASNKDGPNSQPSYPPSSVGYTSYYGVNPPSPALPQSSTDQQSFAEFFSGEVSWSSCQPSYFRVAFDFNLLEVSDSHLYSCCAIVAIAETSEPIQLISSCSCSWESFEGFSSVNDANITAFECFVQSFRRSYSFSSRLS